VAVKIFSGNLSSATLESEAKIAITTPAYGRSQFEPSSPAYHLFQDDLENGIGNWSFSQPMWSLVSSTWHSWSHAWKASSTGSSNKQLSLASPLNFSNYSGPMLRFNDAFQMVSINDKVTLEVSTDGNNWSPLATFSGPGSSTHWDTQNVDLSAYGKMANVRLRFNAQAQSGLLWYLDDVYINAWPAIKTASFTYAPQPVVAVTNTTFTGSYTSIVTTLPITYHWNFCGVEQQTTTPNITYQFLSVGNCLVTLTVQNPYDSATTEQTINVIGRTLTVNVDPAGGGTTIPSAGVQSYVDGTVVDVIATPTTGYVFDHWSGACTGSGACSVTMDANKSVTATFKPIEYTLTVNTSGSGSVTKNPEKTTYHYGDVVQLTAVPVAGWSFSAWNGDLSGSTNPKSITIDGNKSVTATFTQNTYTLTVNVVGSGSVNRDNPGTYHYGDVVQLTAVPIVGWIFSVWSGDLSSSTNPVTITINGNKSVTANFIQAHNLTIAVAPVGGGTTTPSAGVHSYAEGTVVPVTAAPAAGYVFDHWSGACTGSGSCSVTMGTDKNVTVNFTQTTYTLTVNSSHGAVTKSPDQPTYAYGTSVLLTMGAVDPGWTFTGWSGAGCTGTTPCTVVMNADTTVTANFNLSIKIFLPLLMR
jgi:uncharacterized repeat protein (TIGR02543 family)